MNDWTTYMKIIWYSHSLLTAGYYIFHGLWSEPTCQVVYTFEKCIQFYVSLRRLICMAYECAWVYIHVYLSFSQHMRLSLSKRYIFKITLGIEGSNHKFFHTWFVKYLDMCAYKICLIFSDIIFDNWWYLVGSRNS